MLLYKLNSHACQQFITTCENYFAALSARVHALKAASSCDQEAQFTSRVIRKSDSVKHEEKIFKVTVDE
jgi:hypothetical protein